ncbi:MAG: cysteine desulfurase family protein [Tumebacillaceae bacterium]
MTRTVYLDYNATTPVEPQVLETMMPYLQGEFGNPSSVYSLGLRAKKAIGKAREQVADLLGSSPQEITFTSGGSEANSMIMMGIPLQRRPKNGHVITSSIEHPAILRACEFLAAYHGYEITYLPVNASGVVDVEDVRLALRPETVLVTVMMVNNEVGSIQPIREIGELCRERQIHFHCDAVQAVGRLPVDVSELNVDSLSLSAHKIYGPKGVGALYLRHGIEVLPLIHGGGQEGGIRSGTENVSGIVGLGMAAELAGQRMTELHQRMDELRALFLSQLRERKIDFTQNGDLASCYPSTLNLLFTGLRGEALAAMLNQMGISVSIASACSATSTKLSHVLLAMGKSVDEIRGSVRFSMGYLTTEDDVMHAVDLLAQLAGRLREMSSVPTRQN